MTRTFIAIELGTEARESLRREIEQLRGALPRARFVAPASLHLTLAFLGELDDAPLAAAIQATEEAAAEAAPFTLRVAGIGTFGSPRAPRVIWAGVSGDISALLALQLRLVGALEERGFVLDERPFAPHLTLARLKDWLDAESAQEVEALVRESSLEEGAPLPVEALAVMKSNLTPQGARYTRLCAIALAGARTAR